MQDPGCRVARDDVEANSCGGVPFEVVDADVELATSGAVNIDFPASSCFGSGTRTVGYWTFAVPPGLDSLYVSTYSPTTDAYLELHRGYCDDFSAATDVCGDRSVSVTNPQAGNYFAAIADQFGFGTFQLRVLGQLRVGELCDTATPWFYCADFASCLGGRCRQPACRDGTDNDLDGGSDLDDPGCASSDDDDEDDPAVPPPCSNGLDDDQNGLADWPADPSCLAAGAIENWPLCQLDSDPTPYITEGTFAGDTSTAANDLTDWFGTWPGNDLVYRLYTPGNTEVTISTCGGAAFPIHLNALYCDENGSTNFTPETACGAQSSITFTTNGVVWDVWVDSPTTGGGPFTATVTGTVYAGERCDPAQTFFTCEAATTCIPDSGGVHRCL